MTTSGAICGVVSAMKHLADSLFAAGVFLRSALALALLSSVSRLTADLVVHEWGTFTAVSGSDGVLLSGLEVEEHRLPPFVLSHAGFAPAIKGVARPVRGATIKMETPVLYFYSDEPLTARVEVGFRGGTISQWYPERVAGEQLPPGQAVLDLTAGYCGSVTWQVDVLDARTPPGFSTSAGAETPEWPRARVATSNRLRGPKGEIEGFIFYRGIGRFDLPLRVTCDRADEVRLQNRGPEKIPFVCVYERQPQSRDAKIWWRGSLAAGMEQPRLVSRSTDGESGSDLRQRMFPAALRDAGLTADEADAMLATWRDSYFEQPGLRVFWIVPRGFTDAVLPIAITPSPSRLERVLVGRTEILTPEFETQLTREFERDGGKAWERHRYFRAYRERAERSRAAPGIAPARATP